MNDLPQPGPAASLPSPTPTPSEEVRSRQHDLDMAIRRERHEEKLEKYKARVTSLTAAIGLIGTLGAALIGVLVKQTSDVGAKLNNGNPTGFVSDFHRGATALSKLSDSTTPLSQIVPAPAVQTPKPAPISDDSSRARVTPPAPPAVTGGRCFGLDPTNWQITRGPVTALTKGFNIKVSLQNKSAVPRGLAYYGDPALTDDIGDRLTFISTSLSNNAASPVTFAPGVEMSIDLTFPNGSFADGTGKRTASYLSFTLPLQEVVDGKTTNESLACENLPVSSQAAK